MLTGFEPTPKCSYFRGDSNSPGLDIPAVDWILQFDPPEDPHYYIHRCYYYYIIRYYYMHRWVLSVHGLLAVGQFAIKKC